MTYPAFLIKTENQDDITLTFRNIRTIQVMNHERDTFVLIVYWLLKGCKPNRASLKKAGDLITRELEMKFNVQTNIGR